MKFPITQEGLDSWFGKSSLQWKSSDWRIDMGDYLAKRYSIEDFTVLDNYDDYIVDKYAGVEYPGRYTKYAEMNPNYIYLISRKTLKGHKNQSMYIPLDKKYEIKIFRGSPDVRGMYLPLPHVKGKKMGWDNIHLNLQKWRIIGILNVGVKNNFMNWTTNPLNS